MTKEAMMEHEAMRFSSMSKDQLLVRLYKIKKLDKLQCYMDMAEQRGYSALYRAACSRYLELSGKDNQKPLATPKPKQTSKKSPAGLTQKRSLEF